MTRAWPTNNRVWVGLLALIGVVAFLVRLTPVLRDGGLLGLQGYDDGVYFGSALAFVHGAVPYRDFVLVQPPGIVLALSPFALLGTLIGDPNAFAVARIVAIAAGALNAVLVALVASRGGRLAGLLAGSIYAVWITAARAEVTTDLHQLENGLLLVGLLVVARAGPLTQRRALLAGVALGLATTVHVWQAASAAFLFAWLLLSAPGDLKARLRVGVAYGVGGLAAIALVSLPFMLAAGESMIRQVFIDQLARPPMDVGVEFRLRALEGLVFPISWIHGVVRWALILGVAAGMTAIVAGTAWRVPPARLWAALGGLQVLVVLVTPTFFSDYPSFTAPALALAVGTGLATAVGSLNLRRVRVAYVAIPIALVLSVVAARAMVGGSGSALLLADLTSDVASARCVASNRTALLVLTSAFRRNLEAGCEIVVDPQGLRYETDRGTLAAGDVDAAMRGAPGFQRAMVELYTTSEAGLFVGRLGNTLAPGTIAAIQSHLPFTHPRGVVTVLLARGP